MSLKYVMLGFLSETPLTGYDLKKKISDSAVFHWSGNNNQIYKTLAELHDEAFVTIEVEYQDSKPPRKIYSITDSGLKALHNWMLTKPELPQFRSPLLAQLTWSDELNPNERDALLAEYEEELHVHVLMLREQLRRTGSATGDHPPLMADRIAEHWISFYELELTWVRDLRSALNHD